jgi:16S rRNA (adenine1518-N6/adenine1519-N6)-dimethyltransferase
MQTKQQIQQLLASAGIRPNKRLGQHFLVDLNLMRMLIDFANISSNDVVLEAGCGTGSLTEGLAERAGVVIAVEFDRVLAEIAEKQLAAQKNVEIINADILENKHTISHLVTDKLTSACNDRSGRLLLVANLPYNAASAVMMNLITGPATADAMYVTVQKEVAERMTASAGSRHYGRLGIFLSAAGEVKTLKILKPTVFWPRPAVDSAMVSFHRRQEKARQIRNMPVFSEVVNLFMGHRRKMLNTCTKLAEGRLAEIRNWPQIFKNCSVDPHDRPEQISPTDYINLANLCCDYINTKG